MTPLRYDAAASRARGVRASATLMSGRLTWDGADRPFAT